MLKELLSNRKSTIVNNWVQLIVETYPPETSKFLRLQKDRFSNPVGFTISDNAEKLFNEIINDYDIEIIKTSLNEIIKIRAVQDFTPSQAVGFISLLKEVINAELHQELIDKKFFDQFNLIESRIDKLTLLAFDLYMEAREKIFRIRVNEIKSKTLRTTD